jgi:hypothetical protein
MTKREVLVSNSTDVDADAAALVAAASLRSSRQFPLRSE